MLARRAGGVWVMSLLRKIFRCAWSRRTTDGGKTDLLAADHLSTCKLASTLSDLRSQNGSDTRSTLL